MTDASSDDAPPAPAPPAETPPWVPVATVALTALLFQLLVQWTFTPLAEFDAYYHVGMADLYRHEGLVRKFPWMSMSILAERFHDPQLLLHAILLPFVAAGVDPLVAGKLVAALTATGWVVAFHWFLRRLDVDRAGWWSALLLVASSFVVARLAFLKSTALFLTLTLFFLEALFAGRRRRLFALAWLAVYTYQGFPVLLVLAAGWIGLRALLGEAKLDGRPLLPVLGGFACGLLVNPFFPNDLYFLYVELVEQILLKPKEVMLGAEWGAVDTARFLGATLLPLGLLVVSGMVALRARVGTDARLLFFRAIAVVLAAGALVGSRLIEQLVPFAIIAAALTFTRAAKAAEWSATSARRAALALLLLVVLPLGALNLKEGVRIARGITQAMRVDEYRAVAAWLKENTKEGDVIVSQWDDFPFLFLFHRPGRYLYGLNTALAHEANAQLYAVHGFLFEGRIRDPETFLPLVGSRHIVITRADLYPGRRQLVEFLQKNARFDLVYQKDAAFIFRLK
jgi:hypothetical protein